MPKDERIDITPKCHFNDESETWFEYLRDLANAVRPYVISPITTVDYATFPSTAAPLYPPVDRLLHQALVKSLPTRLIP